MKKRNLILLITLFSFCGLWADNTPCLIVTMLDETENPIELATIQRIEFSANKVNVLQKDDSENLFNYEDVKNMLFDFRSLLPTGNMQVPESKIFAYSNVEANAIMIDGLEKPTLVQLFTVGGVMVESLIIEPTQTKISMDRFSNGIDRKSAV